jgi:hypothetical protein
MNIRNILQRGESLNKYSIWVSIFALLLSFLTFYFQHIRIHNDVKATALSFRIAANKPYNYLSDIVFVNNGNRPCTIINIAISCQNVNMRKLSSAEIIDLIKNKKQEIFTGTMINVWTQEPFTINQKEIITKRLTFGFGDLSNAIFNQFGKKDEILEFVLTIQLIDSKGKYHKSVTHIGGKVIGNDGYNTEEFPLSIKLLPSKSITKDMMLLK